MNILPVTDGARLRHAFGHFPSGVVAVCAEVGGVPVGLAASSFTSVSLDPPLVSVCMQHSSTTWPVLRAQPRLGISVLAEGQDGVCTRLASKTGDRFAGTARIASEHGAVFVDGASLLLDCAIHAEIPAGDHDVILLRVLGLHAEPTSSPLVFHGSTFRRLAAHGGG